MIAAEQRGDFATDEEMLAVRAKYARKIRYTGPAARQLDAILAYIKARSPDGAGNVLSRIDKA